MAAERFRWAARPTATKTRYDQKACAVGRPLHWNDTDGGPLLGIPPWDGWRWATTREPGGDLRRFYSKPHRYYCGIDWHARTMSVCILDQGGEILLHRPMKTSPDALLTAIAP